MGLARASFQVSNLQGLTITTVLNPLIFGRDQHTSVLNPLVFGGD